MTRRRPQHARGLATLIAVVMLASVSMATLALSVSFQLNANRTQRTDARAQLRQLLHAGVVNVAADASPTRSTDQPWSVPVPEEAGLLHLTALEWDDQSRVVHIEAKQPERSLAQTVTLTRDANSGAWQLIRAQRQRGR